MASTKRLLRRVRPAVALKRAFDPPSVKRDRADQRNTVRLIESRLAPDACCIDVGANIGEVLTEIVRVAPRGQHIAFEPIPALAAALAKRFPDVVVHASALSDEAGEHAFAHVSSRPGWSGLRARPGVDPGDVEHLTVPVQRLDDVLPEAYVPALIKIDVEGAELGVLRGAEQTLRVHQPLVLLEHGHGAAELYGTGPNDIYNMLTGLGYRIFGLDERGPLSAAEFADCFATGSRVNFLAQP